MNIFEMYYYNGMNTGFFVQRNSWRNTIARIKTIAGISSGRIKGFGSHPYFSKARNLVYAELFVIREDSLIQSEPVFDKVDNTNLFRISCPGTYAYDFFDTTDYKIIEF